MRYSLLATLFITIFLLSACNNNGSTGSRAAQIAPTVSVAAPAKAVTGTAFTVSWTSTDTAYCTSAFSAATTTSGAASLTVASAGTHTYTVTCSGAGGVVTGTAVVAVFVPATAEGAWRGTATATAYTGTRTINALVTQPDATSHLSSYWLVYSQPDHPMLPAGFIAGTGTSFTTDVTTGNFPSSDLLEFNYEGGGNPIASSGSLTSSYTTKALWAGDFQSVAVNATWSFSGSQTARDLGLQSSDPNAQLTITPNAQPPFTDGGSAWLINTATPSIAGSFQFVPGYTEHSNVLSGFVVMDIAYPAHTLSFNSASSGTIHYDAPSRTLTLTGTTFTESNPGGSCTDNSPTQHGYCDLRPNNPITGNLTLTFAANMINYVGTATTQKANFSHLFETSTLSFSGTIPNSPSTKQIYTSHYDATYETTATLAQVQGSYNGSAGVAGALQGGAGFAIDPSTGHLSGGHEASGCTYSGTVTPATVGNVYNVSLTFTAGGSCSYSGVFTGAATLDATGKQLTLAVDNRGQQLTAAQAAGFLFVGNKP